jgi:hypothetical protein
VPILASDASRRLQTLEVAMSYAEDMMNPLVGLSPVLACDRGLVPARLEVSSFPMRKHSALEQFTAWRLFLCLVEVGHWLPQSSGLLTPLGSDEPFQAKNLFLCHLHHKKKKERSIFYARPFYFFLASLKKAGYMRKDATAKLKHAM